MPKHSQLVCQQLENIDRSALGQYQHLIRQYIKGRNGIYALYRGDKLYYVGLAKNLRSRLKRHLKDRHDQSWDRFSVYLTIGTHFIKEMESLLLRITQPPGNKVRGTFHQCQNLERTFAADIRAQQREQLDTILGRIRQTQSPIVAPSGPRRPVLAPYFTKTTPLKARQKGIHFKARVQKDGSIHFQNRTFKSPSLAAGAAVGHKINGWHFWHYQRAPGDWVRLRELRNR